MIRYRANRGRVTAASAMFAATVVVAAACGRGKARQADGAGAEAPPPAVLQAADVAVAKRAPLSTGVVLRGTLNPHRIVELRAQVPGVVSGIRADRGDVVQSGQVLAVIEAAGVRSRAAGARAQVAAAEAGLALAREQLESARTLNEAGALSDIDLSSAQAGYEAAQGQLAAARAQAAAAAEEARRTTISAPVDGAVSERAVSEGEAVTMGQALFTVVNSEILELAGHIPVEQAMRVRPGQPVRFTLDAYPERTFKGTVARVEPMADPDTRQVGVYLQLPNGDGRLIGGLYATGRILTETVENALLVPRPAVRERAGETFVWVIDQGVLRRRPVAVGAMDPGQGVVQVLAGLEAGEHVLVAPGEVTEGMRVRIAPTSQAELPSEDVSHETAGEPRSGVTRDVPYAFGEDGIAAPARERQGVAAEGEEEQEDG